MRGRLREPPDLHILHGDTGEPPEHVTELAGLDTDDVELVQNDGSPCGPKHFLLWNPSVSRHGRCPSAAQEVSHLFAEMVQHGLRCIAFCKTRKLCEAVLARAREILEETSAELRLHLRVPPRPRR